MKLKVIATGSRGNAYLLESDNEILMIECGVNITEIKKALSFDFSKVAGCLLTHEHNDHSCALKPLLTAGVSVYATEGTHKACGTDRHYRSVAIKGKSQFQIGNFKILPFDVKHDAAEPVGFLIEHPECGRTLFLTDTYYCKYTFPKLNNIIIEANYAKDIIDRKYGPGSDKEFLRDRILQSHFSLENCIGMLMANDLTAVNNIVLIHLSDSNSDEKMFVDKVKGLTTKNVVAARNGMEVEFGKTPF